MILNLTRRHKLCLQQIYIHWDSRLTILNFPLLYTNRERWEWMRWGLARTKHLPTWRILFSYLTVMDILMAYKLQNIWKIQRYYKNWIFCWFRDLKRYFIDMQCAPLSLFSYFNDNLLRKIIPFIGFYCEFAKFQFVKKFSSSAKQCR